MGKLRRIFESTPEISFISPQQEFSLYWNSFLDSELGKIYQAIPWDQLTRSLKLKENRSGCKALFSPQGKLALMFLKAYSGMSDRRVYEQLNGNIQWQMFCGIFLGPEKLPDFKIISRIRTELAKKPDIREALYIPVENHTTYQCLSSLILINERRIKNDKNEYKAENYPIQVPGWLFGT